MISKREISAPKENSNHQTCFFNKNLFKSIIAATLVYFWTGALTSCVESDNHNATKQPEVYEAKKTEETKNYEDSTKIFENILRNLLKICYPDDHITEIKMEDDNRIKIRVDTDHDWDADLKIGYKIFKDGKNNCLDYLEWFLDSDYKIHIHKEGTMFIVTIYDFWAPRQIRGRKYIYDEHGNRISYFDQIRENEARFLSFLQQIKEIKEDDKPMFAAILSSMQLTEVEYKEKESYFKIFGEDKEAAYEFMIAPSKDKNWWYWGIITKMEKSAELQTTETDGSSKIYAFTIDNESTSNTKRFKTTLTRVLRDLNENIQKKFGETSNTKKDETSKSDVLVGGIGFSTQGGTHFWIIRGEMMMNKGENVFTRTFESERGEPIQYTLKDGEMLKLNSRNAYPAPDKFQEYYLSENKNYPSNKNSSHAK